MVRLSNARRRVVVTGMGVVSAIGNDVAAFGESLFAGRCGIAPITLFDAGNFKARVAAEVKDYSPSEHFSEKALTLLDRYAQFALVAGREAVRASGLDFSDETLSRRSGVFHGTGVGGQSTHDEAYLRLYGEGKPRLHPATVPKLIPSAGASHLTIEFGIRGPGIATASACSASAHALATAVLMLRAGTIDVALAGGSEAVLTPGSVRAWEGLRVLSSETCRPFSKNRSGTVLGEGGSTVVLEGLDHALARGAPIAAEILGIGMSSDAYHPVQPNQAGIAAAIDAALADAGLAPERVDYINAHGTATPENDPQETAAIHRAFGSHARRLPVSSTKAMHGHALGASSVMELIACVLALQAQCAPPTIHLDEPDPLCDLDYVPDVARAVPMEVALNHSFAFGGLNVVVALQRWTGR